MPVKIYWGPPGSYKSSAAIWDDVSACAKQGRVLITNVRGLSEARVASVLTDIKPGFRIMHFRMDRPTEMAVLRRWWHWAPFGAYFLLDEVQAIYPPFWTAKQMRELDGPTDRDRQWPSGETMPKEMEICFDMHRHGNWDFTFTTPNIKKVRPEIRACAEWAYKHRNLAFTGLFRGSFMEFQHSAEDNASPSDIFAIRRRKVPAYVFQLYDSTATGTAKPRSARYAASSTSRTRSRDRSRVVTRTLPVLMWVATPVNPAPSVAAPWSWAATSRSNSGMRPYCSSDALA